MSDEQSDKRPPNRRVDITTAVIAALVSGALGGGGGSLVTSGSVSADLRETRAVLVGRFDALERTVADQQRLTEARLVRLEESVRALELAEAGRRASAGR